MRIVVNQYADQEKFAIETATDGSVPLRDLMGERRPGALISVYVEVACADTEVAMEGLKESLEWLLKEVEKRRAQPVRV